MIILGIDPTSGAESLLGVAAFSTVSLDILLLEAVKTDPQYKKSMPKRVKQLASQLSLYMCSVIPERVYIESTVMRGKGGESLARATGAFMVQAPIEASITFINNGTVKKIVGGHGKAEKLQVAEGLLDFFKSNDSSVVKISRAINGEEWDKTDALAIAVAGYLSESKI